jgi:ankyrin repeat protein
MSFSCRCNALGDTPLHEAAFQGSFPIVQMLLVAKADPNATDASGRTALYFATVNARGKKMLALLVQYGAK